MMILFELKNVLVFMFSPYADIILRSSRNPRFSTVEYCHNSSDWVTLCDGNWTAADATVVCTQAGKAGDIILCSKSNMPASQYSVTSHFISILL